MRHNKTSQNKAFIIPLVFFLLIPIGVAVAVKLTVGAIPVAIQWPFFEALRTTAAVITGVVGLWLGVLYPEEMRSLIRKEKVVRIEDIDGEFVLQLLNPLKHSLIVLIAVILTGLLYVIFSQGLDNFRYVQAC